MLNLQQFIEDTDKELLAFLVQMQVPDEAGAVEIEVNDIVNYVNSRLRALLEEVVGEVEEAMKLEPYTEWQKGYTKALSDLATHLQEEIKKMV
ncbi:MAG: hypothetical protein AAB922_05670 [Patescibacteria group bacterium]